MCDAVGKEVKPNETGKVQNREKKYSLHLCQQTHVGCLQNSVTMIASVLLSVVGIPRPLSFPGCKIGTLCPVLWG